MSRLSAPGRALVAVLAASGMLASSAHAATVQLFDVPTNDANLMGIARGGDGALYFTERKGLKIGRISTAGEISERAIATTTDIGDNGPEAIVAATDGKVWFTSDVGGQLYRLTPNGGPIGGAPLGKLDAEGYSSFSTIGAGNGGGVWGTYRSDDFVFRVTDAGALTDFPATYGSGNPFGLSPDGTAWFAGGLGSSAQLKHITGDNGAVSNTPFTAPAAEQTSSIAFAPGDPNPYLTTYQTGSWFTSNSGGAIGHLGANGQVTMTPVNGPVGGGNAVPRSMVTGPDRALWWAEKNGIGRLDPATGKVTEGGLGSYDPRAIAFGGDGRLWFVDSAANKVGAITIDGNLFTPPPTLPALPGQPTGPTGPAGPATPGAPVKALAPELSLTVARQSLRTVRARRRIPVSCTLRGAGTCTIKLTVTKATQKKLKLKSATLGSAKRSYKKAGKATIDVTLSKKVLSGLKRAKGSVVVRLAATSSGANLTPRTNVRELTLRR